MQHKKCHDETYRPPNRFQSIAGKKTISVSLEIYIGGFRHKFSDGAAIDKNTYG